MLKWSDKKNVIMNLTYHCRTRWKQHDKKKKNLLDCNQSMTEADLQNQTLHPHLLERKKMQNGKWKRSDYSMLQFSNSMIICSVNSNDHLKYRVDMVNMVVVVMKKSTWATLDRQYTVSHTSQTLFLWMKEVEANEGVCAMLKEQMEEGDIVLGPWLWGWSVCWRADSQHITQSSIFKVTFI
jgi:hypothetical protein